MPFTTLSLSAATVGIATLAFAVAAPASAQDYSAQKHYAHTHYGHTRYRHYAHYGEVVRSSFTRSRRRRQVRSTLGGPSGQCSVVGGTGQAVEAVFLPRRRHRGRHCRRRSWRRRRSSAARGTVTPRLPATAARSRRRSMRPRSRRSALPGGWRHFRRDAARQRRLLAASHGELRVKG